MSIYLDASILVALFTDDAFSSRADKLLRELNTSVVVSDFAAAEFVAALAKLIRMREIIPTAQFADTSTGPIARRERKT